MPFFAVIISPEAILPTVRLLKVALGGGDLMRKFDHQALKIFSGILELQLQQLAGRMSKSSKEISVLPSQAGEAARQVVAMPTTFVRAEKESFREVVQRYTGAAGGDEDGLVKLPVTCSSNGTLSRKPMQQLLHQRRQKTSKEMKLEIKHTPILFKRNGVASPLSTNSNEGFCSVQQLHGDRLLPPLLASPLTPLSTLSLDPCPGVASIDQPPRDTKLQDGFPQFGPLLPRRKREPELLNLFPLTSPRAT